MSEGSVEHPWCFHGCAHVDTREVLGVIFSLKNVQTCRPGADKLSSVNGQIVNIVDNKDHMVSVPINVKATLATM